MKSTITEESNEEVLSQTLIHLSQEIEDTKKNVEDCDLKTQMGIVKFRSLWNRISHLCRLFEDFSGRLEKKLYQRIPFRVILDILSYYQYKMKWVDKKTLRPPLFGLYGYFKLDRTRRVFVVFSSISLAFIIRHLIAHVRDFDIRRFLPRNPALYRTSIANTYDNCLWLNTAEDVETVSRILKTGSVEELKLVFGNNLRKTVVLTRNVSDRINKGFFKIYARDLNEIGFQVVQDLLEFKNLKELMIGVGDGHYARGLGNFSLSSLKNLEFIMFHNAHAISDWRFTSLKKIDLNFIGDRISMLTINQIIQIPSLRDVKIKYTTECPFVYLFLLFGQQIVRVDLTVFHKMDLLKLPSKKVDREFQIRYLTLTGRYSSNVLEFIVENYSKLRELKLERRPTVGSYWEIDLGNLTSLRDFRVLSGNIFLEFGLFTSSPLKSLDNMSCTFQDALHKRLMCSFLSKYCNSTITRLSLVRDNLSRHNPKISIGDEMISAIENIESLKFVELKDVDSKNWWKLYQMKNIEDVKIVMVDRLQEIYSRNHHELTIEGAVVQKKFNLSENNKIKVVHIVTGLCNEPMCFWREIVKKCNNLEIINYAGPFATTGNRKIKCQQVLALFLRNILNFPKLQRINREKYGRDSIPIHPILNFLHINHPWSTIKTTLPYIRRKRLKNLNIDLDTAKFKGTSLLKKIVNNENDALDHFGVLPEGIIRLILRDYFVVQRTSGLHTDIYLQIFGYFSFDPERTIFQVFSNLRLVMTDLFSPDEMILMSVPMNYLQLVEFENSDGMACPMITKCVQFPVRSIGRPMSLSLCGYRYISPPLQELISSDSLKRFKNERKLEYQPLKNYRGFESVEVLELIKVSFKEDEFRKIMLLMRNNLRVLELKGCADWNKFVRILMEEKCEKLTRLYVKSTFDTFEFKSVLWGFQEDNFVTRRELNVVKKDILTMYPFAIFEM